ncbi:endonuclease [Pseudarthrobacter sp. PS3-L1]|uniref:endonuclease n=1 Tax=Pseudarthrobacter sp. PS3-L1 TaxID=3046207 RepID=UPI0024B94A42|nr:endonuclease [Pseudarthrobacter sp. PS3-L1]MDJ0320522.1 endonuclease [Pseudarthrobacter sp. PS3-L1]
MRPDTAPASPVPTPTPSHTFLPHLFLSALVVLGLLVAGGVSQVVIAPGSQAASSLTVTQAITTQNNSTAAVTGFVVGQPTGSSTVLRSGFTSDTALAIAVTASETSPARMLYVQVGSAFRATFGLQTNPGSVGQQVTVTGQLTAYFSHPGLKNTTAISMSGSTPGPDPSPPAPTPGPDAGDYYAPASGKTGTALESSLHQIISVQRTLSYDQVWDALKDTDQDPKNANNVVLLYTGRSQAKNTNGGGVDQWNREHVWAKSHGDFGTATGPGTDVHHLRPTDVSVNSERGNKDFDLGGTASAEAPGNFTDADSWEPRAAVKGDVARMIMYMAVRYEGGDGFADLEMNNQVNNGTSPFMGKLSVLLDWNRMDPPDAFEQRRNQRIFEQWQGNRNPFVDHPEYADAIWN